MLNSIKFIARITLSIALLIVVWHHAHWSVALAATLSMTAVEAIVVHIVLTNKRLKALERWVADADVQVPVEE